VSLLFVYLFWLKIFFLNQARMSEEIIIWEQIGVASSGMPRVGVITSLVAVHLLRRLVFK
jgi:hypothetical protein